MFGYILIVMLVYIGIQIILYDRSYKKACVNSKIVLQGKERVKTL